LRKNKVLSEADDFLNNMLLFTDRLLDNNPELREIQEWVERKTKTYNIENMGAIKSLYWYLALDISHFKTRNWINSLEFARALGNIRDFSYKIANDQNFLPIALSKAQNLVNFNNLALDYYKEFSTDLQNLANYFDECEHGISSMEKAIILDIALLFALSICYFFTQESRFSEIQSYYDEVNTYFQKITLFSQDISPALSKVLNNLKIPDRYSTTFEWESFEEIFRNSITKRYDIGHHWTLSEIKFSALRKYLVSNSVTLDSLQIAYLEDRNAILEKLFRRINT